MLHPMFPVTFWEGRIVDACTESADGSLLFTLSIDPDHTPRCGRCNGDCALVHERVRRRVRDRDLLDRRVWLDVPIHRMDCHHCGGRYAEKLSWIETGERFTRRLKAWIEALVQILPIKHVSQLTGLNWHTVRNIDHRRLKALHGTFNADGVKRLVMDEFALHKGHQYATVVMDEQRLRVLWVGEGRSRASLKPFFDLLGEEGCRRIEAVAMDMNTAFDLEVRDRCPHAEVVFDLFHVVARFGREVIDRVRVDQANAIKADQAGRRAIKRSRWILLRNPENLSESQSIKLDELLAANAPLATVYLLKTAIKEIWYAPSVQIGARRWKEWYRMAMDSGIEPAIRFAKLLKPYLRGILASAKYRMHTSVLEGVNNRIKVIKRMAYGYRDTDYFFLKIKDAFPGKTR